MKQVIHIVTPDEEVGRLLQIELSEAGFDVNVHASLIASAPHERRFIDIDAWNTASVRENDIVFTRHAETEGMPYPVVLSLPFPMGAAAALMTRPQDEDDRLRLTPNGALRRGQPIHLTATEHALLSALMEAQGQTVSRSVLAHRMQADTDGAVNVYIHYLRKKLETNGERIILSTRGGGYRIDARFCR